MTASLTVSLTALQAHTRAMQVTSHNIANAATPGYSRQRSDLGTQVPQNSPIGQIGRGVRIESVQRVFDNLLVDRLRNSAIDLGRYEKLDQVLVDAELAFAEPGSTGLSANLDRLFGAIEELAANPEQGALREAFVDQLGAVADTMNGVGERLIRQRDDLVEAARFEVLEVNGLLDRVVQLNAQIQRDTLSGQNPNDLADERDRLLGELAGFMDIDVRRFPRDGTVSVEVGGALIVSQNGGVNLDVTTGSRGEVQIVLARSRAGVEVSSGSLGAIVEMSERILPEVLERMDQLAQVLIREFNSIHATGSNPFNRNNVVTGSRVISDTLLDTNLDHADQIISDSGLSGIPELMLPQFTDADGASIPRNLTINVTDTTTDVSRKFILRYEPGTGAQPAGRSLEDLVQALNSGRGGGFSVEPPDAGGVLGLTARLASVDGGVRLQLVADQNHSIDFSRALGTRPADDAWTGAALSIAGSNAGLADARLVGRVSGTDLELVTFDATGVETVHGTVDLTAASPQVAAGFTVNFTPLPGGGYVDGQSLAIDLDTAGAGSGSVSREYVAGDAGFRVAGRYTGDHAYDPARPWRMRVVQAGTVGSNSSPPIVEFTWYDGADDARQQQITAITLDGDHPPGSQVPIGEGVYVVFDQGALSTGGAGVDLVVDGQPDQADLLPALGFNTLFDGSSLRDIEVSEAIVDDPNRLALGHARAAGDNSNLLSFGEIRDRGLFLGGRQRLDDFYQVTVSEISSRIQQNSALRENQETVKLSLENRRDQVSGVSIDQEVGRLILQQQAYTAAARVITISRDNIQTLLDLVR